MASRKPKNSKTRKPAANSRPAAQKKNNEPEMKNKGVCAIVLFAISLFVLGVVLIDGPNVWKMMRNFIFGMFGACAYAVPAILCYIAIMLAMGKKRGKVRNSIIEACVLVTVLAAAVDIFIYSYVEGSGYWTHLTQCYQTGMEGQSGGGFLGGLLGFPLSAMFGSMGARITIVLFAFVMVMVLTGTTLNALYRQAARPVRAVHKRHMENKERRANAPRFNVDVPLGDLPEHPVSASVPFYEEVEDKPNKAEKLVEMYNGDKPGTEKAEKKENKKQVNLDEIVAREVRKDEKKAEKAEKKAKRPENPDMPATGVTIESATAAYKFPPVSLLNPPASTNAEKVGDELKANAERLVNTLKSFGVDTRIINISRGPSVTRYELQPSAGVKISKITNLADDIALNLAAAAVRIEAPIPNKSAVGIEIPNKVNSIVSARELIDSPAFLSAKSKLSVALGRDIAGNAAIADLAKMPHTLIAGSTGSGKSVCINSIIISLLYKASPDEVKLLMIDPKVVELGVYNGIPHLLVPVVTDPRKAAGALGWAVTEMLKRYKIFADNSARDLTSYNKLCKTREDLKPMPQIVIIIDELADLMMAAPNEVEDSICRLAQMARAAGMHLVIATQRPSVDVITGIIKANIPSRIAFAVSSQVDSRTILDMGGAEKLMGKGDMLYFPMGMSKPLRVQGCFVSDEEISAVVSFIKNQGETVEYDEEVITEIEKQAVADKKNKSGDDGGGFSDNDEKFAEAVEVVVEAGVASTSLLQRKLKLGYARAARIVDELEEKGIVGPFEGAKPRKVLITRQQWLEMQNNGTMPEQSTAGEE